MAPFLSRLFSRQKRETKAPIIRNEKRSCCTTFDSTEQVRIMLFRERFGQERRLLFDSKAVRKKENRDDLQIQARMNKENSFEKSFKLSAPVKDFVYEWQKQSPDEQMLREMIFGSVCTSYQGSTIKVHVIRCPLQIMISVVYPAPLISEHRTRDDLEESGNSTSSAYDILVSRNNGPELIHLAHSVPVNVPSRSYEFAIEENGSCQSGDEFTSLPAYLNPENNFCSLPRSGSYNSLQRRLLRNKATSIQLGLQKSSDDMQNEEGYNRLPRQNRVKLGLSIVISFKQNKDEEKYFQDFLFTHILLIENHLMKLQTIVNEAYLNRKQFVHLLYEGSKVLQHSIQDLYTAPRLQFPEWLSIITSANHHDLSNMFMQKFTHILRKYDKKETNFFVSTLLTAVLTHHLAWVPTVMPTDAKICDDLRSHKHVPFWVDMLAKSRSYNPLWVQLGDLYGAISKPSKIAKIVVKGCDNDVILIFLQVLSYFIRCSDIYEHRLESVCSNSTEDFVFHRPNSPDDITSPQLFKNFGWSLMAGVSDHYLKDFCLQGVIGNISEEEIKNDLHNLTQVHVLDEPISEAVCILVDTDSWSVFLQSSNWSEYDLSGSSQIRVGMSSLVSNICEAVLNMIELGLPPESCIIYLEDRLQELYCDSLKLSEYVRCSSAPASVEKVASALNLNSSDIPLLLAIALTHSPTLSVMKM